MRKIHYPPKTHKGIILDHLLAAGPAGVCTAHFQREHYIGFPPRRVYEMRKDGWLIDTVLCDLHDYHKSDQARKYVLEGHAIDMGRQARLDGEI